MSAGPDILDALPFGVLQVDRDGRVGRANGAAARILGVADAEAVLGGSARELIQGAGMRPLVLDQVFEGEGVVMANDLLNLEDGRVMELSARPAPAGSDGAVLLLRDVTELEMKLRRAEKARRQVAQQEKMASVGLLAAGVAHEFNNIMATIYGFAQLAKDKPRFQGELVDIALSYTRRAREITDSLLSFSKPKTSVMDEMRLQDVVAEILRMFERECAKDSIRIEREIDPDTPSTLINVGQMEELIVNLLINARQAIVRDGTIKVGVGPLGDKVQLQVSDTGCGIPADYLDRIFEPFFTTKGSFGGGDVPGTGLGLYVSWNIVHHHQGTIEVESTPGKGSTFRVQLPVRKERRKKTQAVGNADERRISVLASRRLRILAVDDEVAILDVVQGLLDRHEIQRVGTSDEALAAFEPGKYDYVILDVVMPGGVDGFEVFRRFKERDPDVKIIVLTGRTEDERLLGLVRHAYGYLRKPFGLKDLVRLVIV